MRTYVADFIPRFRQFSKQLDNETLLVNQHWVMVDEITSTKTVYIFQRNNRLLLSKDGAVEKAEWEMIDSYNVLVTVGEKSFMFKHGFLDENVLALKLDGKGEYALFCNENMSNRELNSVGYMETFLKEKYQVRVQPRSEGSGSVSKVIVMPTEDSMNDGLVIVLAVIGFLLIFLLVANA
jgi:hypothetical protein